MAGAGVYRIEDEPRPGGLQHLAVNPMWPLFGVMFAGSWLALPWFVLNGFAVGSPTRWRELAIAFGGFAGSAALAVGLLALYGQGVLGSGLLPYIPMVFTVWKLGVGYVLYQVQSRTFFLYEHFGGQVRNGFLIVALGFYAKSAVLEAVAGTFLFRVLE